MAVTLTAAQQAVVDNEGGALLVSAAAGSGKTKVLIDRLLRKVCDPSAPVNIDEFLIITYTNAAAAELRAKISAALAERLAAEPENRHLQRQTTRLYLTQISTVHAFCATLLRRYAHELDLPADFRVGEEYEMEALRERVLDTLLEEIYPQLADDAELTATVDQLGYGRDDRRLAGLVLELYEASRCQIDAEAWYARCKQDYAAPDSAHAEQTVWGAYWMERLHAAARDACACLRDAIALSQRDEVLAEKYAPLFEANLAVIERYCTMERWNEVRQEQTPEFGRLPVVRKATDLAAKEQASALRKTAVGLLRDALEVFYGDSATVCRDLTWSFLPIGGLFTLLRRFDRAYREAKRQRKLLDFSDLEHEAIRLLTDRYTGRPTAAARELAQQYAEILVDEYQDSNAVQETIFQAVSRGGRNLFMVGDVKQSIYRFRLADPEIFLQKYNAYPLYTQAEDGQGRKILLSDNFRSRAEILEAANDVFSLVMHRESAELDYGEAERLRAGRAFPAATEPAVELHCIDLADSTDEDGANLEKSREEAAFAARRIRELLDGGCMVTDGETVRPARAGDIAILMRSPGMTANIYRQALAELGIDSVSDRSGSILETSEAEIWMAMLAIIDNPHQDLALSTAMASPVFGFTPDELAQPRTALREGDFYDCLLAAEPTEKLTLFLAWLRQMRETAKHATLTELIDTMYETTGIEDVFAAMPDGAQRVKNLAALRELAVSTEQAEHCGLYTFRLRLETIRERGVLLPAGQSAQRGDAVQIMSIHKSKGLEFPIVVLADLSRRFNLQDSSASILTDPKLGIAGLTADTAQNTCWPTIAHMAAADRKTRQAVAEEMRVLYVAMTRAKEKLIMSVCSAQLVSTLKKWNAALSVPLRSYVAGQARRLGDWVLLAALCRTESGALHAVAGGNEYARVTEMPWMVAWHEASGLRGWKPAQTAAVETETPPDAAAVEKALAYEYPHMAATRLPSKITATQLKGRMLDAEAAEQSEVRAAAPERSWREPAFSRDTPLRGREKGNATHLFMQFARYEVCGEIGTLKAELNRLQTEKFLTAQQAEAVELGQILHLFQSPFGRRILTAQTVQREFKFSILTDAAAYFPGTEGEQVLLQGVVDCFWQEADGLVIVDFKTDRISGDLEGKAGRYAPQVTAYAKALARIFGAPVKEQVLYFFDCDQAVWL